MRRAVIAFLTTKQIKDARNEVDVIPEFVVEILSENDNINQVEKKVIEYFKAGVKVVWLIFLALQSVYIYHSKRDVKICFETDVISVGPVLPELELTVDELFST